MASPYRNNHLMDLVCVCVVCSAWFGENKCQRRERERRVCVCVCVNSKAVASVVNSWQLFCP